MQDPTLAVKEGLREVETQLGKLRVLWSEAEFAKGAAEAEVKSLRAELARLRKETVRKDEEWRRGYEELRNARDHFLGEYNRVTNGAENQELERLRAELKNLHAAANLELQASENKRIAETQAIRAGWAKDREELLQRCRSLVADERDAALARVTELSHELFGLRSDVTELKKLVGGCSQRELNDYLSARRVCDDRETVPVPVEGEVRSMNVCCCSARQVARNEAAHKLFVLLHPDKKPVPDPVGLGWVVGEVARELSALRKDRETLNRVRGAVGAKS